MLVNIAHMEHNGHDGKILHDLIKDQSSIEKVAERVGKHRNTITNWCQQADLETWKLIAVGKALRYDLSTLFHKKLKNHPDLKELYYFNEDPAPYITVKIDDETHIKLLEIQLERKRMKKEPTAINKIASEKLKEALDKTKKPD